ncbi:MAG TPA: glycan-binding surface protein, partial [Paludibacter sp.]|nr:glycan-binding surface protein [Paludibacter sp.]
TIPVLVYTSGNATIADPTVITSISPIPVKPGDNLTITGTYMDLIKTVILPDGNKIDSAAITINATKTAITVKVPLAAKEGVVKMLTYSGLEIASTDIMKLVGPAITSVSPMLVKNGETLTIKGTNLDLVKSVTFGAVDGKIIAQSETSIDVTVPMTAVNGVVVLNTNSGLTATSAALTMVKPTFTSISPLSLTAGETVTIAGTDLDLVRKVIFVGGLTVNVTPSVGAASLNVVVPTTGVGTGPVILETVNGTQITSTDQLAIIASTKPAITSITHAVAPGGLMTITGKNLNFVESIYFEDNVKAVLYGVRSETSITVYIPVEAKHGNTTFTMNSFVGEKIVSPSFVYGTDPITDPSLVIFNFEDRGGNNSANNAGGWGGIANGKSTAGDGISGDFFEITASNWNSGAYWWVADNWVEKPYPTISGISNYVIKMDVRLRQDIPVDDQVQIKLRLSGNKEINFIPSLPIVNNKYSTGGQWVTITIPTTGLQDPTVDTGDWGIVKGWNPNNVNFTGFCVDNIRYEKKSSSALAPKFQLIGM